MDLGWHQIWSRFFFLKATEEFNQSNIIVSRWKVLTNSGGEIAKKVYNHQTKTGWKLRGSKVTELVLPTKKCWWENLFQPFLTIQLMIISQLLLSDHFWCFIRNLFRGENGEEWRFHLDHQKVTWAVFSSPWLVVWYRGWNPTQLYGDYNKPI